MTIMNGAIKYILFDIGGVLINFDVPLLVKNLSRRTGADPDQLLKLFSQEAVIGVETGLNGAGDVSPDRHRPCLMLSEIFVAG